MYKVFVVLFSVFISIFLFACNEEQVQITESDNTHTDPNLAKKSAGDLDLDHIAGLIADINSKFEAAGSTVRLDEAWFFTVGHGTPPYMRLRTGSRWADYEVDYVLDESDYTTDVSMMDVDAALASSYDSWNNIQNTGLVASRIDDDGTNFDILDGTYDEDGNCVSLYDVTSPNLDIVNGLIYPYADIVVGGWAPETYFSQCLGSSNIIGVTWTWSDVDSDGDNYRDRLYVEQYYNPAFAWTTTDAVYLDFGAPMDIETIAVHENGHAHGLGHMGGPVKNQPFKLQPNGKVFNPEAVMNPFYLGGEERTPLPADVAGMRTMYSRPN